MKTVYAGSKSKLEDKAQRILSPILRNESAIEVWFPALGQTTCLQGLFGTTQLIYELGHIDQEKCQFIYIRGNMIISGNKPLGFLRLLYKQLVDVTDTYTYNTSLSDAEELLLSEIHKICQDYAIRGKKLVFIIDEFEQFNNEEAVKITRAISTIILIKRNTIHFLIQLQNLNFFSYIPSSDLSFSLSQNVVFMPLPTKAEIDNVIQTLSTEESVELSKLDRETVEAIGPNILLLREYFRLLKRGKSANLDDFFRHEEVQIKSQQFLSLIGIEEQKLLRKVLLRQPILAQHSIAYIYLFKVGILKKTNGEVLINSPVIKRLLLQQNRSLGFALNEQGELIVGNCNLSFVLTTHEYKVLKYLFLHKDKVCTRESVAEVIWGDYFQKMSSDWAIDKTVSRIRKKLASIGLENCITTIKKQGFKFI